MCDFPVRRETRTGNRIPGDFFAFFLGRPRKKVPRRHEASGETGPPRRRAVRSPESERLSPHANGGAPRGGVGAPKTTQRAAEFRASERQPPSSAGSRKMFPAGGRRRWRMMAGTIAEDCPASGLARLCGAAALCSGIGWPGAQPAGDAPIALAIGVAGLRCGRLRPARWRGNPAIRSQSHCAPPAGAEPGTIL